MSNERYTAIQVVMMPADLNPQGTIFGGVILAYIDQAAYVGAKREVLRAGGSAASLVTVAINRVEFKQPVFVGDLLRLSTQLVRFGRTSVTVHVLVEVERGTETLSVTEAEVVYVGLDEQRRPKPLLTV